MIKKLLYKQVNSIVKRYDTEGHSPLLVFAEDFSPYVLKFRNNSSDNYSIAKEFICHYLLKCWAIPTPDISGLIVDSEIAMQCDKLRDREKRLINNSTCFGSRLILNAFELMNLVTAENVTAQKRIINTKDLLKIALFDIWVENDDRRPSNNNILLEPRGKNFIINAIDHAFTFSTLIFKELQYTDVCFSHNDSILYTPLGKSIIRKTKVDRAYYEQLKEMFYLCVGNAKNNFHEIISNIPDNLFFTKEDETFLADFLFNDKRNNNVFHEFSYIVNSIKK